MPVLMGGGSMCNNIDDSAFELPCTDCTGDERPACSIFVSGGTGKTIPYLMTGGGIPFGPDILSVGEIATHTSGSGEFMINRTGRYTINYQVTIEHADTGTMTPRQTSVFLSSDRRGWLDGILLTAQKDSLSRCLTITLEAGEKISLRFGDPSYQNITAIDPVIILRRVE